MVKPTSSCPCSFRIAAAADESTPPLIATAIFIRMLRCQEMAESAIQDYRVANEPYYLPVAREVELFEAAHSARLPVILKGPTGCGKTRFVEHMAWRLERPLITVACHEDLSSTDLVGRFLLEGEETIWHDGPLTSAVRHG